MTAYWDLFPREQAELDCPKDWLLETKRALSQPGLFEVWDEPPVLTMAPYDRHVWVDVLSPTNAPIVCTSRARNVICSHPGAEEEIQWLPVIVDRQGERRDYQMLRLPNLLTREILDDERTVYSPGGIMKAVLDARKVQGRHIFRYPYERVHGIIVSDALRRALEDAGCTGVKFEPVPTTHTEDLAPTET